MTRKIAFLNDPLSPDRLNLSMQISEKLRPMFDRGGSSNIRPQSTLKLEWLRPSKQPLRADLNQEALETLKSSIQEHGILEPLIVRLQQDHYEVVCGHRRLQAAQELGLEEVPVVVRELDDPAAFVLSLHENIHRDDLTPLEEAKAYQKMLDGGMVTSQRQLAKILGVSHTRVNQKMALLEVPGEIQEMMEARIPIAEPDPEPKSAGGNPVSTLPVPKSAGLTERHIRAIRRIISPEEQVRVARDVVAQNLNAAETEQAVTREITKKTSSAEPKKRRSWVKLGLGRYREFDDRLLIEIQSNRRDEQLRELRRISRELEKM